MNYKKQNNMVRTFSFHNGKFSIKPNGFGSYLLTGLGVSIYVIDSRIYDWCDDNTNKKKNFSGRKMAYKLIKKYKTIVNIK